MKEDIEEQFQEYCRKTDRIEIILFGFQGENGLRSQIKQHEEFINQIKPQLQDLVHSAKSLGEIKTNIWRIVVILVTSTIIAVASKFIQLKTGAETLQEIKTIQEEQAKH